MTESIEGGDVVEMTGRHTDVSRNIDGTWLNVADRDSMPLPTPPD